MVIVFVVSIASTYLNSYGAITTCHVPGRINEKTVKSTNKQVHSNVNLHTLPAYTFESQYCYHYFILYLYLNG